LFSILYITAYAVIIKFTYPELEITALTTVIATLGFTSAVATNYLLKKSNNNQGQDDE
jgi:hypothetical protein